MTLGRTLTGRRGYCYRELRCAGHQRLNSVRMKGGDGFVGRCVTR
jgi:hypothetical protein